MVKIEGQDLEVGSQAFYVHQNAYNSCLTCLRMPFSPREFAIARGKIVHVSLCTRPDDAFLISKPSQVRPETASFEHQKLADQAVLTLKEELGPAYRRLELEKSHVIGYSDASFANNEYLSLQLGMAILLKDGNDNSALIYYSS